MAGGGMILPALDSSSGPERWAAGQQAMVWGMVGAYLGWAFVEADGRLRSAGVSISGVHFRVGLDGLAGPQPIPGAALPRAAS